MNKIFVSLVLSILSSSILLAECNTELLEDIKTQIKEKRKTVESLTVCKKWPYKNELSIFVMTFPSEQTTEENLEHGLSDYDIHTVVYNTNKKVIENHLYQEALYSSDAVRLDKLLIDTARYNLGEDTRAFGIKAVYYGSSRANPYDITSLDLYVRDKKSLRKVLETIVLENVGEWDTNCEGVFNYSDSVLHIGKTKTNGLYNINIKQTNMTTHNISKGNECEYIDDPKKYRTLSYTYNGNSYKVKK